MHHKETRIVVQRAHESRTYAPGAVQAFNAVLALLGAHWDSAAPVMVIEKMSDFTASNSAAGTR